MKIQILLFAVPLVVCAQTTVNGGRIFKGRVDASGAISTLPYRTGTGSPAGRDSCAKPGESYFQTDATAGQNIWTCTAAGTPGTWAQVTGSGGTAVTSGTTSPAGACVAGSLYVRTDMNQLHVCGSTNTWELASYLNGLAASIPVNCIAGQIYVATDTGSISWCATPGNPGTWKSTSTLPSVGTPGTYTKVTTDGQGRVSSGSTITGSDVAAGNPVFNTLVGQPATAVDALVGRVTSGGAEYGINVQNKANNAHIAGINGAGYFDGTFSAANATAGTLPAARLPALSGDATSSAGSATITVSKLNGVALSGLGTGLLKNTTGSGVPSVATPGTDYAPATTGSSLLKGNGSGGFNAAVAGVDYAGLASTNAFTGRLDGTGASSTAPLKTGAALPATCAPGDLFFNTSSTAGQNIFECQSANTWTQQLNSGSGGAGFPDPGANGLVSRTALNTLVSRVITGGTGINVANGDGVSSNPTLSLDTTFGVTQAQLQTLAPDVCLAGLANGLYYNCTQNPGASALVDGNGNPATLQFCPANTWNGGPVTINNGLGAKPLLFYGYDPPANILIAGSCYLVTYNASATVNGTPNVGAWELRGLPGFSANYLHIANAAATGTTLNALTKLTGAPSTATIPATTDTNGVIGITVADAGTTLTAVVQTSGPTSCIFDGPTISGDYIQISNSVAGDCHDSGTTYPSSGQVIGRVLSSNGSGGTYAIDLFGPTVAASGGGGGGSPGGATGQLQWNNTAFAGVNGTVVDSSGDLRLGATPTNTATLSLFAVGNAISGGNSAANGGTYFGINQPAAGAGSAADLVNLQNNGSTLFKLDYGQTTANTATFLLTGPPTGHVQWRLKDSSTDDSGQSNVMSWQDSNGADFMRWQSQGAVSGGGGGRLRVVAGYIEDIAETYKLDSSGVAIFGTPTGSGVGHANLSLTSGAWYSAVDAGLNRCGASCVQVTDGGTVNSADLLARGHATNAVANAAAGGTTQYTLTKLTGAPSTAVKAATTDTMGIIGIAISGAGTSGTPLIATGGVASCVFDGATTAGDYVQVSSTVSGDCHDTGSSRPGSNEIVGRVLSTNAAGGTYSLLLQIENQ